MAALASPQVEAPMSGLPTSSGPAAPHRFLGRQPILDAERRLFGYELLYRDGENDRFSGDPEVATREVLDHWLMLIPDSHQGAAFINCTRNAIVDGLVTLLPPESTVLEILEDVDPDPTVVNACLALKAKGYRLALDGFLPRPCRAPFLALADFIKIDFMTADFFARKEIYALASGTPARLVAEKIESDTQLHIAISEGCSLFQGYFFSQPILVESRAVPRNHLVYLSLLAQLQQPSTDLRKLEKIVSGDAALCFRVLRLANSALQHHPGAISTIGEALLMVGEDALRRLISVSMTGAMGSRHSPPLISMTLTRARFCELLAPALGQDPAEMYLLGMLSLLDALLQMPFPRILQSIPIGNQMKLALAGDSSPAGLSLALVRSLESCDWTRCDDIQRQIGLTETAIATAYTRSLQWAAAMSGNDVGPAAPGLKGSVKPASESPASPKPVPNTGHP
jgi:c-di-GMP-related signal transduction protein